MRYGIKQIPHNLTSFLFSTAYLLLVVEPHLMYRSLGTILPDAPMFAAGWPFLEDALGQPGGFVMYVCGFLSQGYYYSWLGTAVIVLAALFLCELSRRHLVAAGYARATVLTSFPAIALVLICSRYKHPLPACLVVSFGLLWSLVFESVPVRRSAARVLVYGAMAAVVFWLGGAGALGIFALMAVIRAVFVRRDWPFAALAVPASVAIIWGLAQYVFLLPPQQVLRVLTPASATVTGGMKTFSKALVILLYGFLPVSVLLLFLGKAALPGRAARRQDRSKPTRRKDARAAVRQKKLSVTLVKKIVVTVLPTALMVAGLYLSHDPMSKPFVRAHDCFLGRQWSKILELGGRLPPGQSNPFFNHDIIRALYHTGRLPHDMFNFPQTPHGLLLTHEQKVSYLTQAKLCDTFLELGLVNLAEKLASEIFAAKGHSALAIEKLAWINIIKGEGRTARVYLNALSKDLIYRETAGALLGALDNGFTPDQQAYIDRIRLCMHQEGHGGTGKDTVEQMLTGLLARNPHNKMAFEYLMACYLLTGQVGKIVPHMERLSDLGYQTMPIPYEEALLIHIGSQGTNIDVDRFSIRPQTIQRYTRFVQLRNSMQPRNRHAILRRLITEFGSSYFFYFTFGCVGVAEG